jgi:hypothetical protein
MDCLFSTSAHNLCMSSNGLEFQIKLSVLFQFSDVFRDKNAAFVATRCSDMQRDANACIITYSGEFFSTPLLCIIHHIDF